MQIHLSHTKKIADDIYSFYFEHPSKLRYVSGQFIELTIEHNGSDIRGIKRWFTLSSAPSENLLCITTKIVKDSSSFKKALLSLRPSNTVIVSEAMGDFIMPKDETIQLVFIAGGIGITPFRSMIKSLESTNQQRNITLLYYAQDKKHIAFQNDLQQPFVVASFITDGSKITAETMNKELPAIKDSYIYISGPEPMAESLATDLLKHGIDKHQVITDYFPGYTSI